MPFAGPVLVKFEGKPFVFGSLGQRRKTDSRRFSLTHCLPLEDTMGTQGFTPDSQKQGPKANACLRVHLFDGTYVVFKEGFWTPQWLHLRPTIWVWLVCFRLGTHSAWLEGKPLF